MSMFRPTSKFRISEPLCPRHDVLDGPVRTEPAQTLPRRPGVSAGLAVRGGTSASSAAPLSVGLGPAPFPAGGRPVMPAATLSAVEDLLPHLIALRRDLHANPELGYAEHRTAARVADELRALGVEVTSGVGGTGVVGVLRNGGSSRRIGLRADMDALPLVENT